MAFCSQPKAVSALSNCLLCFAPGAGIKSQVCSLVELLVTTLYQAYAVFYLPPAGSPQDPCLSCGLLFSTLEGATSSKPAGRTRSRLLTGSSNLGSPGWRS